MIAGLEEISSGELWIGDKLVNDVEPKDRDIAMVFQNYALYPHMSVYDNMAFGLKLRKVAKDQIDRLVHEAAKILDIEHLLDRKPKALSGGQRQRVAMGRAIVRDPKVFLMDEPLSNLDAKLRVQMRIEISKLHQRLETTHIKICFSFPEYIPFPRSAVTPRSNWCRIISAISADRSEMIYIIFA
jgi:multiple sugar transport system ATP-binding protein